MHIFLMLGIVGAGYAGYWLYKRSKAVKPGSGVSASTSDPNAQLEQISDVQNAANTATGDGKITNPYDAVLGVASLVGGIVGGNRGTQTVDEFADTAEDTVDAAATLRNQLM